MKIRVKVLKNEISKQGFRKFQLSAGKDEAIFDFGGQDATKSSKRTFWILFNNDAKFNETVKKNGKTVKTQYAVDGEFELESTNFVVQSSSYEYEDQKTGKLRQATSRWLIPVDHGDETCTPWHG